MIVFFINNLMPNPKGEVFTSRVCHVRMSSYMHTCQSHECLISMSMSMAYMHVYACHALAFHQERQDSRSSAELKHVLETCFIWIKLFFCMHGYPHYKITFGCLMFVRPYRQVLSGSASSRVFSGSGLMSKKSQM